MRPTSSQFHQHFTYEFFVRTLFRQLFSSYMYVEKAAATSFVQKNWHQRYLFGAFFHKLNTKFGLFLDVFVILRSIDFKVKLFVSCIKCSQFENAYLKLAHRAFFTSNCGPRILFASQYGPNMVLSLRPLVQGNYFLLFLSLFMT